MAAPVIGVNGVAVIKSIEPTSGQTITVTGYAAFFIQSLKATQNFDQNFIKDSLGFDAAAIARNNYIELDMEFIPYHATLGDSVLGSTNGTVFLAPQAAIAFANLRVTALNATYMHMPGTTINLANEEVASMTLKVRRYLNTDQNTQMTTVITAAS